MFFTTFPKFKHSKPPIHGAYTVTFIEEPN